MKKEIEKKFLVTNKDFLRGYSAIAYKQGYLCTEADRTVRVRIAGDKGFITIKGRTSGCSRAEYEYEIPHADATGLLNTMCLRPLIEKVRYRIPGPDDKIWEVDVFEGENEGLVVAEIELSSENESFVLPYWVGCEVTDNPRYYNSHLSQHPYKRWK